MEGILYLRQLLTEMVQNLSGEVDLDEKFEFDFSGERFRGRVYERYNGYYVVVFEVVLCETQLTTQRQDIINNLNGLLPFTTFRVEPTNGGLQTVIATHSLLVSTISVDQVVQTLESLVHHSGVERPKFVAQTSSKTTRDIADILRDEVSKRDEGVNDTLDDSLDDEDDDSSNSSSAGRARKLRVHTTTRTTEAILADLRRMVGLDEVKDEVAKLVAAREFSKARIARGLPSLEQSPHLVFTGNPGTGKTTVARIVADLYKALGVLKKGHVVEADCSKLIAAYVGQTPIKTQRVCEEARGGVLFIDEAYGLSSQQSKGYGPEAIETLLKFMEDNRGEIVVIVAGYPAEMQGFLDANPGLRSRFDMVIDFPDYDSGELVQIFDLYLDESKLTLTPEARVKVETYINALARGRGFGNGREMRNLFNNVVRRHAVRVVGDGEIVVDDLTTIAELDIPAPPAATPEGKRRTGYL